MTNGNRNQAASHTAFAITAQAGMLPVDRFAPSLVEMLGYWQRLAGESLPRKSTLDPIDMPALLPFLIIWDVLPDKAGYRCRLAGTEVCKVAGRELRGTAPAETGLDTEEEVRRDFDAVRDGRGLNYVERSLWQRDKDPRNIQRLITPWADRDGRLGFLIGIIAFL